MADTDQWITIFDQSDLPEKNGYYMVFLAPPSDIDIEWGCVTEMFFNKDQMLWEDGSTSYNAVVSVVDESEYRVTHWRPMPDPPQIGGA